MKAPSMGNKLGLKKVASASPQQQAKSQAKRKEVEKIKSLMPEYATEELEKVSKSKKTVIQSMCMIFLFFLGYI